MSRWTTGNDLLLLENGEDFYPQLLGAIDAARTDVRIETFIWREDSVGRSIAAALIAAAERGVQVRITADGFGSAELSSEFLAPLVAAGVSVYLFDPQPALLGIQTNLFCRLHRKLAVIDDEVAFVGGINLCEQQLRRYGPQSMQDYAVRIVGPMVSDVAAVCCRDEMARAASRRRRWRGLLKRFPRDLKRPGAQAQAAFVTRDNDRHTTDIETMYRVAIRGAQREILIACAYFFPGYRFIRALARAARRGVDVKLILQGNPDVLTSAIAASLLYDVLLAAGIRIFHYVERPLHAKLAVIDGRWATVGSSNLDPTSLGLNLEANVIVLDDAFGAAVKARLERLLDDHCEAVARPSRPSLLRPLVVGLLYHLTRRMSRWGRLLRRKRQLRKKLPAVVVPTGGAAD
jgi:cardiolipin synthase A/B